jgi:hypothetical protein
MAKIERNAPCPCGSGKKYKNCCEGSRIARRSPRLNQFLTGMVLTIGLAAVSVIYLKLGAEPAPPAPMQGVRTLAPVSAVPNRHVGKPQRSLPGERPIPVAGETTATGLPNYPGAEPLPNVQKMELKDLKPGVRESIERISKQEQEEKQKQTFPVRDQSGTPESAKKPTTTTQKQPPAPPPGDSTK